jgi:hypothetical protein
MKSHALAWIALVVAVIALALVITQYASNAGTAVIQGGTTQFGGGQYQVIPDEGGGGGASSEAECTAQGKSWVCQYINGQYVCQCL